MLMDGGILLGELVRVRRSDYHWAPRPRPAERGRDGELAAPCLAAASRQRRSGNFLRF
jgi:hypothetical protein